MSQENQKDLKHKSKATVCKKRTDNNILTTFLVKEQMQDISHQKDGEYHWIKSQSEALPIFLFP